HNRWFLLLSSLRSRGSTLFPYTTLFRSEAEAGAGEAAEEGDVGEEEEGVEGDVLGLDAVAGVAAVEPEPLARAAVLDRVERDDRSEEHTSELQSRENLVCRLLPEKKKKI